METCVHQSFRRQSLNQGDPLPPGKRPAPNTPSAIDYQTQALRYCELGKLYLERGRHQDALTQFEQALTAHPHDVESWYSRAEALACLNRYDDALHSLDQAQELAGVAEIRLWVQKAILLILLDRPQAALNCCNRALWLNPAHTQAWLFRGVALYCMGEFQASYRSYQRATQADSAPSTDDALRQLCHDILPNPQAS